MDFSFIGGSMGSVIGEILSRAIKRAYDREIPLIIVAQSGGEFDSNRYDYDILLNAVLTVGLQGDLAPLADETANLTVFAPNDIGFIRLARDLGYAGTDATSRDGRRVKAAGLESGPALAATW